MRKPSDNLTRQLAQLNLCSASQLMACTKQVDRLSDGLPDFDSIWLDVLVQKQVISRFQADHLQKGNQADLQVGSLTLREQLGERSFLAMTTTNQPVVLQRREFSSTAQSSQLSSAVESLHSNRRSAPTSLAVPIRLAIREQDDSDPQFFVASHFQPGWTVAELLVRGGRLPWQRVLSIGQQALTALQWLHSQGCCHGNIDTSNVRVSPEGQVVLVGAAGSRFAEGGISLSANLKYDEARFMAPERALNLQPANFQSDLYSLAAVLWNLLAARDAFLTTDPISRVTKAGQENLPDIRTLVPDCPKEFALAIQRFSKSNPQLRPANPAEAIALINTTGKGNHQELRSLVKTLPDRLTVNLPPKHPASRSSQVVTLAVACLMVLAFASYGIQRGLIPSVASLTSPAPTTNPSNKQDTLSIDGSANSAFPIQPAPKDPDRIRSLPKPDIAGVVVLESGRKYWAADLEFAGVMHVETSSDEAAQIVVPTNQTWNLSAAQLNLSNVHVLHSEQQNSTTFDSEISPTPTGQPSRFATALHVKADAVSINGCILESSLNSPKAVCLHWTESDGSAATFQLQDCVLKSSGTGISTSVTPKNFSLRNCLLLVRRSALQATVVTSPSSAWPLTIHEITQPTGLTFADFLMPDMQASPCQVIITAGESVVSPSLALVQFAARQDSTATQCRVEFKLPQRGNAVIVPPQISPGIAWDQSLKSVVALAEENVSSDAILSAELIFRGQKANSVGQTKGPWQAFELIDYDGPKLTKKLPGVQILNLPNLLSPTQRQKVISKENQQSLQR